MLESIYIIVEQVLIHMPLMCGAYISFSLLKVPDLSLESAYVSGALCAASMVGYLPLGWHGVSLLVVMGVSLFAGAAVGALSGALTRLLTIPHLLSAIIVNGLMWGINQIIVGTYVSLSGMPNVLIYKLIARHPELPVLAVIGCCIIGMFYCIARTQLCYAWAVFGSSAHFFRHYGINASYVFLSALCMSNALAGLTGYLFAQSGGFADINMGVGKTLFCITALMLGKTVCISKKPIVPTVPVVGSIFYFFMQQLLLKVGFNLKYFTAVQALLVLGILIIHARKTDQSIDHLGV